MPWMELHTETVLHCASQCSPETSSAVAIARSLGEFSVKVSHGRKVNNEVVFLFTEEGNPPASVTVRRLSESRYLVTKIKGEIFGFSRPPEPEYEEFARACVHFVRTQL